MSFPKKCNNSCNYSTKGWVRTPYIYILCWCKYIYINLQEKSKNNYITASQIVDSQSMFCQTSSSLKWSEVPCTPPTKGNVVCSFVDGDPQKRGDSSCFGLPTYTSKNKRNPHEYLILPTNHPWLRCLTALPHLFFLLQSFDARPQPVSRGKPRRQMGMVEP